MAVLRILFTRLRTEEKLLKEAAERLGIPCELQLVSDTVFGGEPFCSQDDVVLARLRKFRLRHGIIIFKPGVGRRRLGESRKARAAHYERKGNSQCKFFHHIYSVNVFVKHSK